MKEAVSAELASWLRNCEPAWPHEVCAIETADFLKSALEGASVGTWQLNVLTGLVTWDKVTSQIFGMEPFAVTTGALLPVYHEDRDWMSESLRKSHEYGTVHDAEFRAIRRDGVIRWLRGIARPIDTGRERTDYLAGIVYDITEQKRAKTELAESERQLRAIIAALPGIAYRCDVNAPWRMSSVSGAVLSLTGYSEQEFTSCKIDWLSIVCAEDLEHLTSTIEKAIASHASYSLRYRIRRKTGEIRWVEGRGKAAYDPAGRPICLEGFIGDVDENVVADQRIRETEERYRLASKATSDLIWDWDLLTDQLTWSDALGKCFGYAEQHMRSSGQWWKERIHPDDRERILGDLEDFLGSGSSNYIGEYRFQRGDGSYAEMYDRGYLIRNAEGIAVRMVGAMQDLTERKDAERRLIWAATRDPLTHLPNRSLFRDTLGETLRLAKIQGSRLAVVLLDLDDFKQVNDTLGHDAGDALLKTFASRLEDSVSELDMVARLGGDEFALLLRDVFDEQDLRARTKIVLDKVKQPFVYDGRIFDCSASLGAALFPHHGTKPQELVKHADIALYVAKGGTRGELAIFEPRHRMELQKRISMVSVAKRAVQRGGILPYYQPKIRLSDGSIYGFEALLRWKNNPADRVRRPAGIAAAFDDLEVACSISDAMIDQVINDVQSWTRAGVPFGHVAVNASAAEFRHDDFGERLLERLHAANVPTNSVQLEVTETVFLGRGAECVERALKLLSAAGVLIALDDFGTGYASLRHLKQFPVDVIKIDQSFVAGMNLGNGDQAIVQAVLNLGQSLDIEVVAEGIEDKCQESLLLGMGCKYGQGFLYSEALPAERALDLMHAQSHRQDESLAA